MRINLSRTEIKKIPSFVGVYSFLKKGKPIYIGKSINVKARLLSHLESVKLDNKERAIVSNSDGIEAQVTDSEFKALILESRLIQTHHPHYNTRWKDDKSYLYLKISVKEEYPKIQPARKEENEKARYFGPFPSAQSVGYILGEIRRVFPFCTQERLGRQPCFYSKMGLCNPCPSEINNVKVPGLKRKLVVQYKKNIRSIVKILEGKTAIVESRLIKELKEFVRREKYEEAIGVRNRLYYFQKLIHQQLKPLFEAEFNQSDKALNELKQILKPYYKRIHDLDRIECYDISNLLLKEATASMVVMEEGNIAKGKYKRFRIKNPKLKSDLEMLEEAIKRRFQNDWPIPNLLVVDGGTPQVHKIREMLKKQGIKIPLIGIAKHPDRLIAGIQGLPRIKIGSKRLGFNLIRRLRDESHRFARKYHLYLRDKAFLNPAKRYN